MDKIAFLERTVSEVSKEMKIDKNVETLANNRFRGTLARISIYLYMDTEKEFYLLEYDKKRLDKLTKWQIIHLVIHELSHVKLGQFEQFTLVPEEELEYQAEEFALQYVKIHYPEYYDRIFKYLKKRFLNNPNKVYRDSIGRLCKELVNG